MGFFGRERVEVPPHPRQEPRIQGPLTAETMERVFTGCVDFAQRPVALGGVPGRTATLCYLSGMVKMERVSDYILRPMALERSLGECSQSQAVDRILEGALYNLIVVERTTADQGVFDLINGWCLLFFPECGRVLSFLVQTEEKRSISASENEPPLKGPRDSFVESIRTNTSLLRRRVRSPGLRIKELLVGRQTVTPVDIVWIDGLTNPKTVAAVEARIGDIDIDALIATGNLEEYIADDIRTAFPTLSCTERPDRFSAGVIEGRVGVLVDGLPLGWLLPSTLSQFFKTPQDKSQSWMAASALTVLRYLCMLITLFLPAAYIAAVTFHLEMLPTKLALSIISAKQDVPFTTVFEVLLMLTAFEIIQEAGLRLPSSIGQTVSILGGLVVGSAAVEARIVSPAVLIAVAVAGIAGYTMPSQDFASALRIWRFLLAVLAALAGMFGVAAGGLLLICHLASLESFGVAYLTPFASGDGEQVEGHTVLRQPLPWVKLREAALKTRNRRNQR
ncbi:MAG TPA: spore germination protein [Candidatus Intestinimonas pullistercoris]|uniref:Spore germination protein n=1 Tax=Candidatus Intestinimonas pullistercoris TaxID=2838623 RepID=A0A9D2P0D2_9FIRM|nr:spore germination protein [uncultured Intestinimonas sp.]HJC41755.1 spore germination protein [Candidatus Intestinimonas pullistercoris]